MGDSPTVTRTEPARATYGNIVEGQKEAYAAKRPAVTDLERFEAFLKTANPIVRRFIDSLSESGQEIYFREFDLEVGARCREGRRASLMVIIDNALKDSSLSGADRKTLTDFRQWLQTEANPQIRQLVDGFSESHVPEGGPDLYTETYTQVVWDYCLYRPQTGPEITALSPRSLTPGEDVAGLRIYGSGLKELDDDVVVRGPFGDVAILAKDDCEAAPGMADDPLCTEEFISTNPFQVPTNIEPGTYPIEIVGSDGTVLATTSIEIVAKPERVVVATTAEVSVVPQWVKTWQPDLRLETGYPASVGGEMHPLVEAAADQTPVFGLDLGVRPQFIGREGMKKTTKVVLDGEVSGRYAVTADGESRDHLTLGVDLSIPAWAKGVVPDLSLDYTYFGQQEDRPNRHFTDESGHRVNFGVGLSRNLGLYWLDGRIYYDLRHDFLSLDLEEHRIGGELTLFKSTSGWLPTIKLDGYGMVGHKEARESIDTERFGDSELGIDGGGLKISAQFNNPTALRVTAGWERLNFATFPAIDSGFLDLAMTFGKAGRFGLNYHYNEFDPYYQSTEQGAAFRWTPSWKRWDSLTLQLGYDHYTAPRVPNGLDGSSDALDIRVMFDPLKAIWPSYSRREE
jgi:hypothetical protein